MALQTAAEQGADYILISEYYKYGTQHRDWHCDRSSRCAIVPLSNIPEDEVGTGEDGFVWVTTCGSRLYSCYWSPNTTDAEYEQFLRRLEASIRSSPWPVLVAGDFNAKHSQWSSPVNDRRGEALADLAQVLDLVICNYGDSPTREKDGSRSYIDVTLASSRLQHAVSGWTVLEEESLSDHYYIAFVVGTATAATQRATGWSTRHLDRAKFLRAMEEWEPPMLETAEECARELSRGLTACMDASAPRKPQAGPRRRSVYWWSQQIAELRTESNHRRRVYQRRKRRQGPQGCQEEHNAAKVSKLALVTAIRRAKDAVWADLCALVDDDPWGKPYRLVMSRLGARRPIPGIDKPGRTEAIVDGLFPAHALRPRREWPHDEPVEPVTIDEIKELARGIPGNKAPGPDGIPGEALKLLAGA